MENMDLTILFTTKSQANDFAQHLTGILDALYTANFNLEKFLMQNFGIQKKEAMMKLLQENKIAETSVPALEQFFKKIVDAIAALPLVSLTIAFEPTDETLAALSQWFLFTLKKQVLFDIRIDRRLVAGVSITANGKYKDYSLKGTFEKIVQQTITTEKPQPQHSGAVPSIHQSTQ